MKYYIILTTLVLIAFSNVLCQDTTFVGINEEFTATINMELVGEVSAVGFDISFDPTALQYISDTKKQVFPMEIVNLVGNNRVSVGLAQTDTTQYIGNNNDTLRIDLVDIRFKLLKKYAEISFANGEILRGQVNPNYAEEWHSRIVKVQDIPSTGGRVIMRIKINKNVSGDSQ